MNGSGNAWTQRSGRITVSGVNRPMLCRLLLLAIALGGGLAACADAILIPERPFSRAALAEDAHISDNGKGNFSGITLAHNLRSKAEVDALLRHSGLVPSAA